jgi:hypothetical protein
MVFLPKKKLDQHSPKKTLYFDAQILLQTDLHEDFFVFHEDFERGEGKDAKRIRNE